MYSSYKKALVIKGLLLFTVFASSCVRNVQQISLEKSYRKDLSLVINSRPFIGVGEAASAEEYSITIKHKYRIDFLNIETCHRSISIQDAFYRKVLKNRKKFVYNYIPSELEEDCFLEVSIITKKEPYAFGTIVFQSKNYKLKSLLSCNGELKKTQGTSICQSKIGLNQLINFNGSKTSVKGSCNIKRINDSSFKYTMTKDYCLWVFKNDLGFHRHYSFGYNQIILRGT